MQAECTNVKIAHPYMEAIIFLGMLNVVLLLVSGGALVLNSAGLLDTAWPTVLGVFTGWFLFMLVLVWVLGLFKRWKMYRFLRSNRVLVHWRYTDEEWQQLKDAAWEENRSVLAPAMIFMTVTFGLIAAVVTAMVRLEDSVMAALSGALVGALVGLVVGAVLGTVVGGGNYLGSMWARRGDTQSLVALGANEILSGRDYFRSNGKTPYIKRVTIAHEQEPPTLVFELHRPVIRGESDITWNILVPTRMVDAVSAMLPRVRVGHY